MSENGLTELEEAPLTQGNIKKDTCTVVYYFKEKTEKIPPSTYRHVWPGARQEDYILDLLLHKQRSCCLTSIAIFPSRFLLFEMRKKISSVTLKGEFF